MNILRTATLVAIFIKCATTSGGLMSQFREAVDGKDMEKTVKLCRSALGNSEELGKIINYVVGTTDPEFIFNFAKRTYINKGTLLVALHRKNSPKIIEEAFKVFNFSQEDVRWVASDPELMCSPNNLFKILGKIEKQRDQERAIENGVWNLFKDKRAECLDPLLVALEDNGSFMHLKNRAIKTAFEIGSNDGNKSIVERFHDHPAVTPEEYVYGLIVSGNNRSAHDPIFIVLLGEADQNDLNAVKKHDHYNKLLGEFKEAIDKALLTAKPGGSRSTLPIQRAELVMETFENDSRMKIPTVISQLIAFYLVDKSVLKSRTTPVKKTIATSKVPKGKSDNRKSCIIS